MKFENKSKILALALSLVLLVSSVFAVMTSAESDGGVEILAQNIVYGEKVSIAYAVKADISDAISGNIGISYYWSDETAEEAKKAILLDTTIASNLYDGKYPVFVTEGVPAKELDKVAFAAITVGEVAGEFNHSYSAVQYLYTKLYKEGFAAKTEEDGLDFERKSLYENLLAYGASAQSVLINGKAETEEDKVTLVTNYKYAYTLAEGVTLNGVKAVFGEDALEINAAYTGDRDLVGWIITDKNGDTTEIETSTFTVEGVALVEPKFGVHVCADNDNDHFCDVCGEKVSECVNANATVDHKCDVCNKVCDACTEGTVVDGLCDVCKVMSFDFSITTGVHLSTGSAVIQDSITFGETYTPATKSGIWANIVNVTKKFEGREEAANNVLKVVVNDGSAKNTSVNTLGGIGAVYFTPTKVSDDGGNIHVLEFDYNWSQASKKGWRNPFNLFAYDAEGKYIDMVVNANGSNNQYCVLALNNGGALTEGTVVENAYQLGISGTQTEAAGGKFSLLDSDTWYRIRYVWDQSTGKVDIAASNDDGETWYSVCSQQTKKAMENAAYLTIGFEQVYGAGGIMYFDDIVYNVVSEMPDMPANNGK